MKTTLILSTLILFAAFTGCSDNLNVTDPLNQQNHVSGQQKPNTTNAGTELPWDIDEFSVNASGELMVENKAVYINPPFTYIASYLVTFDVFTNADKLTNGYIPLVKVHMDRETVFESSAFPEVGGAVTTHVEVRLDYVRFYELTLYISLFQGDKQFEVHNNDGRCILKLSNINLYRFD